MNLDINKILTYFGVAVNGLFILFGGILIFGHYFNYIPDSMKKVVGVILLAYGLIRIISLKNKLSDDHHEAE
jgi:hypothetical protein